MLCRKCKFPRSTQRKDAVFRRTTSTDDIGVVVRKFHGISIVFAKRFIVLA